MYLVVLKVLECLRKLSIKMSVEKSFRDICLTGNLHQVIDYIKSGKKYDVNEHRSYESSGETYHCSLIYEVCKRGHKEVAILLAELGASIHDIEVTYYFPDHNMYQSCESRYLKVPRLEGLVTQLHELCTLSHS